MPPCRLKTFVNPRDSRNIATFALRAPWWHTQTICASSSSSSLRAGMSRIGIGTLPAIFAASISHGSGTSTSPGAGRDVSASHSARAGAVRFCIGGSIESANSGCSELEARRLDGVHERFDVGLEHGGDAELLFVDSPDDLRLHHRRGADERGEPAADLQLLEDFLRQHGPAARYADHVVRR